MSLDEADEYYNLPKAKRKEILQLCDENGVVFWLAGHTHKTSQLRYKQITLLNGETTSQNFDGHLPGFRLLTIHPDQSFDWEFISCEIDE
jgi:predicted phosphodiesterase